MRILLEFSPNIQFKYMTNQQPPSNPNSTKLQNKTNIQRIPPKVKIAGIGGLTVLLTVIGYIASVTDVFERISNFIAPPKYPPPEWIGTKIEKVYSKRLPNHQNETTLVQTDKAANGEDALVRNVDQNLTAIDRALKNNSGNFTVSLERAFKYNEPVCLQIYGSRIPKKSEFKNIIQINKFPSIENYETLTPEQRNAECKRIKDEPLTIIVSPSP